MEQHMVLLQVRTCALSLALPATLVRLSQKTQGMGEVRYLFVPLQREVFRSAAQGVPLRKLSRWARLRPLWGHGQARVGQAAAGTAPAGTPAAGRL